MKFIKSISILSICLTSMGCSIVGSKSHFEADGIDRAAFDLRCSKEKLVTTNIGDRTFGVVGCNKQAVYMWAGGTGYVRNSGIQSIE